MTQPLFAHKSRAHAHAQPQADTGPCWCCAAHPHGASGPPRAPPERALPLAHISARSLQRSMLSPYTFLILGSHLKRKAARVSVCERLSSYLRHGVAPPRASSHPQPSDCGAGGDTPPPPRPRPKLRQEVAATGRAWRRFAAGGPTLHVCLDGVDELLHLGARDAALQLLVPLPEVEGRKRPHAL